MSSQTASPPLPPAALVTGAARRLGASMVERLVAEGFRVVLHYNSSGEEAEALAARLRAHGGVCHTVQGDLLEDQEVRRIWAEATALVGPISLLVNNASLFRNDDLFGAQDKTLDQHMAVNLKAPCRLTELLAAQDALPERALVVNMLDNKIFALNPDFYTYTLSKTALHTATVIGAMRLRGRPRLCAIAPSITLISGKQTEENFQKSARINPLERRAFPEDICEALMTLWHDTSMNGQILSVDGGQALWRLERDVAFLVKEGLVDG